MFRKFMYKYVSQVDERDCGLAALSMVLKSFGTETSIAQLRELAKTNIEGTTALGIIKAAQHFKFETKAIRADMKLFEISKLPYPFIAHVVKEKGLQHYYTVFKVSKNYLIIGDPDPSVGVRKIWKPEFEEQWDGVAIFFTPEPQYHPQKNYDNLFALLPLIFKQHKIILQIMLASLLTTVISIVGAYYFQGIIDTYVPSGQIGMLGIISIGLIVAYIFQGIFGFSEQFMLNVVSQRLTIDIILGYIRHIFELPMNFFYTRRVGEITSRFADANQIINALASTIISLFLDLGMLIFVGIILAVQNVNLFLLTLLSIPLYSVIILLFMHSFDRLNQETMQSNAILNSSIIEDINGIETIKTIGGEETAYGKVDREFVLFLKKSFTYGKLNVVQNQLKMVLQLILNVCILWFGTTLVISGKITLGQLITYNALLVYFTNPIESVINLQTKIQAAKVAHNRLNEVFLVNSEFNEDKKKGIVDVPKHIESLVFQHVMFRYGFGKYVLNDVNLDIKSGEKIAIVGASGSGKSTLVKTLVKFIDINQGRILYGNKDFSRISRSSLRKNITYVPQEPYIFTGTIADNILLGKPNATMDEIITVLKMVDMFNDVQGMPNGLQTELSQDGTLSGGQRQRIALARGVIADSPILILDESTSNLDVITEKIVIDRLLNLKDKTIIFVAHRLNIAKMVNRVCVMDEGRVVQNGTHDTLMDDKEGLYHSFF